MKDKLYKKTMSKLLENDNDFLRKYIVQQEGSLKKFEDWAEQEFKREKIKKVLKGEDEDDNWGVDDEELAKLLDES